MSALDRLRVDGAVDWPRVLLVGLAVAITVTAGAAASTSTGAFDPYNGDWDGVTDFRDGIESDPDVDGGILLDAREYDRLEADGTVVFVLAPTERYDDAAATAVREFVTRGGTLVVFENFGDPGNDLLAAVGATARVDGDLVRDERDNHRGPSMPIATPVGDALPDAVERVWLNYASAIHPGEASILVSTSEFAYLGDDGLDAGTALEAYPVATTEPVGDGRVVAVGDPSVTTNAMLRSGDNAAFLEALYADADRVRLDRSIDGDLPPLASALLTVRESGSLQLLGGAVGIAAVAGAARRPVDPLRGWVRSLAGGRGRFEDGADPERGPGLSAADRERLLRRRHPEWDDARIRRVASVVGRTESRRDPTATANGTAERAADGDPTRRHDA